MSAADSMASAMSAEEWPRTPAMNFPPASAALATSPMATARSPCFAARIRFTGRSSLFLQQALHELGVLGRVPRVAVVEEDVDPLGAIGQRADLLHPLAEFRLGVVVVVAVAFRLAPPGILVASVKADVGDRRRRDGDRRDEPAKPRLVHRTVADRTLAQELEDALTDPAVVPELDKERMRGDSFPQEGEVIEILHGVLEGPGKLAQDTAQFARPIQRLEGLAEGVEDRRVAAQLVGHVAVRLDEELELGRRPLAHA